MLKGAPFLERLTPPQQYDIGEAGKSDASRHGAGVIVTFAYASERLVTQ